MQIREFMTQPVVTVYEDISLEEVARTMLEHHIGGVPVVNAQGKLSGIITVSDFAAKEQGFSFSTFRAPRCLATGWEENCSNRCGMVLVPLRGSLTLAQWDTGRQVFHSAEEMVLRYATNLPGRRYRWRRYCLTPDRHCCPRRDAATEAALYGRAGPDRHRLSVGALAVPRLPITG
jgi:CBS domain